MSVTVQESNLVFIRMQRHRNYPCGPRQPTLVVPSGGVHRRGPHPHPHIGGVGSTERVGHAHTRGGLHLLIGPSYLDRVIW